MGKIISILSITFLFITCLVIWFSLQEIADQQAIHKAKEDYLNTQIHNQKEIIDILEKENKTYKDDNILLKDIPSNGEHPKG